MQCRSCRRHCKHTIFLKVLLVAVTSCHIFLESLGFLSLLLNGDDPAVALLGVGSLELVGVGADLERKDIAALLGHIGDLVLQIMLELPQEVTDGGLRGG